MKWMNVKEAPFRIAGFPFFEKEKEFRRLQLNPPVKLPETLDDGTDDCLVRQTAGGQIIFRAKLKSLYLRAKLPRPAVMDHMAATGETGFDFYASEYGEPLYHSTTRFEREKKEFEAKLFEVDEPIVLNMLINFPLYNGVQSVELGFDDDAIVEPGAPFEDDGRIVVYGSSIDQGGCATRPGMLYSNILSRWLNTEFINLGFSGQGKAEPEVAQAINEIENIKMFIFSCAPNCPTVEFYAQNLKRFIDIIRVKHPTTPILIYSNAGFPSNRFHPEKGSDYAGKLAVDDAIVRTRKIAGDEHIYLYRGTFEDSYLGHNVYFENMVDGVHPTDLGFMQMAKELYKQIRMYLD